MERDHVGYHGNWRYVIRKHEEITWYDITSYVTTKKVVISPANSAVRICVYTSIIVVQFKRYTCSTVVHLFTVWYFTPKRRKFSTKMQT